MHTETFFLALSCPVLTNEQTLAVIKNGRGPEALYRIQMFKFVGSSYTDIFLHCNVQICHSSAGSCQPVRSHSLCSSQLICSTFSNTKTTISNVQYVYEINKNLHSMFSYASQLKSQYYHVIALSFFLFLFYLLCGDITTNHRTALLITHQHVHAETLLCPTPCPMDQ